MSQITEGKILQTLSEKDTVEVIRCPQCQYYYAPVCTFYKWLPMVSRQGYCYHAIRGRYEGPTPTIGGILNDSTGGTN